MEDDFIGEGWEKLDPRLIVRRPPKILWGEEYKSWPADRKIEYLQKLAATMNHAARLVQEERDALNELCEKKEKQIEALTKAIGENNNMVQQEMTRANLEQQGANKRIAELNARVRELERGGHG